MSPKTLPKTDSFSLPLNWIVACPGWSNIKDDSCSKNGIARYGGDFRYESQLSLFRNNDFASNLVDARFESQETDEEVGLTL